MTDSNYQAYMPGLYLWRFQFDRTHTECITKVRINKHRLLPEGSTKVVILDNQELTFDESRDYKLEMQSLLHNLNDLLGIPRISAWGKK